ncbi:thermonuclease family protein [Herbidospora cretacea]|uniref:thermonuclease family protein n=1 Tax=Herbidospora cretacea TaxID=28444 RepID=UPI000774814C|nr:thermonuclease family protein [Herbidospora cretacea]
MSHLSRPMAVLACAALLAPLAAVAPATAAARPKPVPAAAITVKIKKVVDGDTVDIIHKGRTLRVELLEIDAPERPACWSKAAAARTAALLVVGKGAYVLRDKAAKDAQGRHLFYVWNAAGTFVNRSLVRGGYAKAVLVKPNDKYIKAMRADQAKAKAERLRVWSGTCDSGTTAPKPSPTPSPTPTRGSTPKPDPTSSSTPSPTPSGGGGTDPRFDTCAKANAAGYGPYYKGTDPEYAWYQDRDNDGVVCER